MNPCRNGGQCIEGQAATVCKCQVGFYGTYCQGECVHMVGGMVLMMLRGDCGNDGECEMMLLNVEMKLIVVS